MSFTATNPADKRIVVMPDCFNPPTREDVRLMNDIMNTVTGDLGEHIGTAVKGIFLPAPDDYVVRKMNERNYSNANISGINLFTSEARIDMLKNICESDKRLSVSTLRINNPELDNLAVLEELQKEYPGIQIQVIIDITELSDMRSPDPSFEWHRVSELVRRFKFILEIHPERHWIGSFLEDMKRNHRGIPDDTYRMFSVISRLDKNMLLWEDFIKVTGACFFSRLMDERNFRQAWNFVPRKVWSIILRERRKFLHIKED